MARRPTIEVLALCAVVFIIQQLFVVFVNTRAAVEFFALGFPLTEYPWTVVTSVYAHASWHHLFSNAIVIALAGLPIEGLTTRIRFHLFVLWTGALAGFSQILITSELVLGASGAAFALLGYVLTSNRVTGGALDMLRLSIRQKITVYILVAAGISLMLHTEGAALYGHFTGLLLGLVAGRMNILRAKERNTQVVS